MSREVHVPFYERLGVQFPRPTHRAIGGIRGLPRQIEHALPACDLNSMVDIERLEPWSLYRESSVM